ncbi:MAG: helix-turn-helix domain-containing protein [Polyangiaceae bacterium]
MARVQSIPDADVEFLRERVRSPARLSVLLLVESEPRAWSLDEVQENLSLPASDVREALASLANDGLIEECCVRGHWMFAQRAEEDRAALAELLASHRSGRIDSFTLLNVAALRRIRQSARLLIRNGLRYSEDSASTDPTGSDES